MNPLERTIDVGGVRIDPPLALALNVTVAVLTEVLTPGIHKLVTVCEDWFVPVPPHETGALTVPELGVIVTEPLPVPAKLKAVLRAAAV